MINGLRKDWQLGRVPIPGGIIEQVVFVYESPPPLIPNLYPDIMDEWQINCGSNPRWSRRHHNTGERGSQTVA